MPAVWFIKDNRLAREGKRAIKDGYDIGGKEAKQKITCITSENHSEKYNDPEEKF